MKLCYALRRGVFYPIQQDLFGTMPPKEHRPRYLKLVKAYGFEALEIPANSQQEIDDGIALDFGKELADAGLPAGCVRAGGLWRRTCCRPPSCCHSGAEPVV